MYHKATDVVDFFSIMLRLFLEKLPKEYPEYNKPEYKVDRSKIKKLVKEAFPRAEELKKKLLSHFEAEKAALETKLTEEVVCNLTHPSLSSLFTALITVFMIFLCIG